LLEDLWESDARCATKLHRICDTDQVASGCRVHHHAVRRAGDERGKQVSIDPIKVADCDVQHHLWQSARVCIPMLLHLRDLDGRRLGKSGKHRDDVVDPTSEHDIRGAAIDVGSVMTATPASRICTASGPGGLILLGPCANVPLATTRYEG
jgi:hypothetical protein